MSVRPCSVSGACCFDPTHCSKAPGPARWVLAWCLQLPHPFPLSSLSLLLTVLQLLSSTLPLVHGTHAYIYEHVYIQCIHNHSTALCIQFLPLYVETLFTAPAIKWKPMLQCYFWVMPHVTLLAPGIWSSGRLCNSSAWSWLKYNGVCEMF